MVTATLLASNLIADAGWYEHCDGDFRGNLQNNHVVKDHRLQRRLATASRKKFAYSSSADLIASATINDPRLRQPSSLGSSPSVWTTRTPLLRSGGADRANESDILEHNSDPPTDDWKVTFELCVSRSRCESELNSSLRNGRLTSPDLRGGREIDFVQRLSRRYFIEEWQRAALIRNDVDAARWAKTDHS
jgi:hypothetical protein